MPPGGSRTHNLSWQAAEDLRLRPRGHWDRQLNTYIQLIIEHSGDVSPEIRSDK